MGDTLCSPGADGDSKGSKEPPCYLLVEQGGTTLRSAELTQGLGGQTEPAGPVSPHPAPWRSRAAPHHHNRPFPTP